MDEYGLLAPLLVAQAQLVSEQPCCRPLAGTDIQCPFGMGGVRAGGAHHRLAQGAQALVAGLRVRQRYAQSLGVGVGYFVQH